MWFSVVGTGTGLRATTEDPITDFKPLIYVLTGECIELNCVAVTTSYDVRSVAWMSVQDELYYLLVGHNVVLSASGYIGLSVEMFDPIANDSCETALNVPLNGFDVFGSVMDATADLIEVPCGLSDHSEGSPGVWYTVRGSGNLFVAPIYLLIGHRSELSVIVFRGSCEVLSCVTDYSGPFAFRDPVLSWESVVGANYFVLVRIDHPSINFTLTIEEVDPPPNDFCLDAIGPLPPSANVTGYRKRNGCINLPRQYQF